MLPIQPKNFLLPLVLLSIAAPGVNFLGSFWMTARWVVIAALALYVLFFSVATIRSSQTALAVAVIAYVGWCMLTYSWSKVPDLSLMKLVVLALVVFACFRGGYQWIVEHQPERVLDFLWPWSALALSAWVLGTSEGEIQVGESFVIHSGATGNPNFLGFIVASSTPVIFLILYRNWADLHKRLLWCAILGLYMAALNQSGSRASYLLFVVIACGLLAAQSIRRLVFVPLAIAAIAGILSVAAPYLTDSVIQRNIYKDPGSDNVFYSRESPWEESYEAAVKGGLFGLGYGVTYGEYEFEPVLSTINYGREKGNAQLAIVEETGLVGLMLYAVMIGLLFLELVTGFLATRNKDYKIALGIVIGTLFGLIVHSSFEAWWVAPGSVEFGYFWVIAGAGCAMARAAVTGRVTVAASNPRALTPPERT